VGSLTAPIHVRGIWTRHFFLYAKEVAELPDHMSLEFSAPVRVDNRRGIKEAYIFLEHHSGHPRGGLLLQGKEA
jgi:hypothetical protein